MTNRIATEGNESLVVPLEEPRGPDGRRGVEVVFPGDLAEDEWGRVDAAVREQIRRRAAVPRK